MAGAGSKKWARLQYPNLARASAEVSRDNNVHNALDRLVVVGSRSLRKSLILSADKESRSPLHGPNRGSFRAVNHLVNLLGQSSQATNSWLVERRANSYLDSKSVALTLC